MECNGQMMSVLQKWGWTGTYCAISPVNNQNPRASKGQNSFKKRTSINSTNPGNHS